MLERYLEELAASAGRELSAIETQALVAETRAHLEDSIQARLELGLTLEEAEREAVVSFGQASKVGIEIGNGVATRRYTGKTHLLAIAYALFIAGVVVGPPLQLWSEGGYHGIFVAGYLALAAFAIASFRSRRPTPVRIALTGFLASVCLWVGIGSSWLNLYLYGGSAQIPRWELARVMRETRTNLANGTADRHAFDAGWQTLKREGIEGLRVMDGYQAPVVGSLGYGERLKFGVCRSAPAALEAWRETTLRNVNASNLDYDTHLLKAVPRAQADPWGNYLSFAPSTLGLGAVATSAGIAVDLAFGGLGTLAFRIRRRRRGGGLRA